MHDCIQEKIIERLDRENEKKSISQAEMKMDIMSIKETVEKIDKTQTEFIKNADRTYVKKETYEKDMSELKTVNSKQDEAISWNKKTLLKVLEKLAYIGGMLYIIGLQTGWWG